VRVPPEVVVVVVVDGAMDVVVMSPPIPTTGRSAGMKIERTASMIDEVVVVVAEVVDSVVGVVAAVVVAMAVTVVMTARTAMTRSLRRSAKSMMLMGTLQPAPLPRPFSFTILKAWLFLTLVFLSTVSSRESMLPNLPRRLRRPMESEPVTMMELRVSGLLRRWMSRRRRRNLASTIEARLAMD